MEVASLGVDDGRIPKRRINWIRVENNIPFTVKGEPVEKEPKFKASYRDRGKDFAKDMGFGILSFMD
ncbi:hypothetical protein GCM10008014_05670 [Paenibacillus silvae]|uniref:Uncharacterized protein n=1 Tax=Paenibacillus silvae TaxID=1325358 RepID=A0ABQ1YZ94_9BACL|nr:hypothetical protein GCM10008014_05670 [Paenibacillus silvae]